MTRMLSGQYYNSGSFSDISAEMLQHHAAAVAAALAGVWVPNYRGIW